MDIIEFAKEVTRQKSLIGELYEERRRVRESEGHLLEVFLMFPNIDREVLLTFLVGHLTHKIKRCEASLNDFLVKHGYEDHETIK